jgi:hypothetical protein
MKLCGWVRRRVRALVGILGRKSRRGRQRYASRLCAELRGWGLRRRYRGGRSKRRPYEDIGKFAHGL